MNDPGAIYNADYFLRGKETGLSNYENYRWLSDVCLPCVHRIAEYMGCRHGELVLDIGCAIGTYTKAFRMMGFEAFGYDISQWAIENALPEVKRYVSTDFPKFFPDWVLSKDNFEHIRENELAALCEKLNAKTLKGLLIIVPLTEVRDGPYLRKEDEMDATHVIRWPMQDWITFLELHFPKFTLSASYHVPGIKAASLEVPHSTGFFKLTK